MLRKLQARGFVRGPEEFYISEKVLAGLKSLRENWALQIQPRRGDLKVAQDGVLGVVFGEISSPEGTAEFIFTRFSRPSGTNDGWDRVPRTGVLGYFQGLSGRPDGAGVAKPSSHADSLA